MKISCKQKDDQELGVCNEYREGERERVQMEMTIE